jgi:hypothetical protein
MRYWLFSNHGKEEFKKILNFNFPVWYQLLNEHDSNNINLLVSMLQNIILANAKMYAYPLNRNVIETNVISDRYIGLLLKNRNKFETWGQIMNHIDRISGDRVYITSLKLDNGEIIVDSKHIASIANEYFVENSVANNSSFNEMKSRVSSLISSSVKQNTIPFNFTEKTIETKINEIKYRKTAGCDEISSQLLKIANPEILKYISIIFHLSINSSIIPNDWKHSIITPIHKRKNETKDNIANYRPVSLLCTLMMMLEKIVADYLLIVLKCRSFIVKEQHGYRKGHSAFTQLLAFTEDLDEIDGIIDCIKIDFYRAFDLVDPEILMEKLINLKCIDKKVLYWLLEYFTGRTQKVKVGNVFSSTVEIRRGIPQGSALSNILFLICINDLSQCVKSKIRQFGDDAIIYREIKSLKDCKKLQKDLISIEKWSEKNKMKINTSKCSWIRFKKNFYCVNDRYIKLYKINRCIIQRSDEIKYLGMIFKFDLSWDTHIQHILNECYIKFEKLKRCMSGCSSQNKLQAYINSVRRAMEENSQIWDSCHTHEQQFENLQEKVAYWILGSTVNGKEACKQLGLQCLIERRHQRRLHIMWQIYSKHVAYYDLTRRLAPSCRYTRNRPYHYLALQEGSCSSDKSFMRRTIHNWNNLPRPYLIIPHIFFGKR